MFIVYLHLKRIYFENRLHSVDHTKDINDKIIVPSKDNQFMSNSDRSNALADLITDMELYGIVHIKWNE